MEMFWQNGRRLALLVAWQWLTGRSTLAPAAGLEGSASGGAWNNISVGSGC